MSEFGQILAFSPGSSVVSANDNETSRVNEGCQVISKSPSLARSVEEVMSKETDETSFKSYVVGNSLQIVVVTIPAAATASVATALREALARNTQLYWREFKIAPLWKRFVAESIDFILLFLLKLAITFIAVDWFELLDLDRYFFRVIKELQFKIHPKICPPSKTIDSFYLDCIFRPKHHF